jgi:hypothetical protein
VKSIGWWAARPRRAAWFALTCVVLAACSSGGASPPARHSSSAAASPSATAEPASGAAAIAAIKSDWVTFFNGKVPVPRRLSLLQDGQQFAGFVRSQAHTTIGSLVLQAAAQVGSVRLGRAGQANVRYTILLGGKPLEKNLKGTAVYLDGGWKVAVATFCGLLHMAYGAKNPVIPAVCGS